MHTSPKQNVKDKKLKSKLRKNEDLAKKSALAIVEKKKYQTDMLVETGYLEHDENCRFFNVVLWLVLWVALVALVASYAELVLRCGRCVQYANLTLYLS